MTLDFLRQYLKNPISLGWSRAVYMRCLMWSNVTTLFLIISYQRNRRWSQNKLRIQVSVFFHTCSVWLVDVTFVRVLEKKNVSIDRTHWAAIFLISPLTVPWKTLERRAHLVTTFTEVSVVFQCLLGKAQLDVEAVLMLGFWSGSSQSLSIRRLKSLSFLDFCHFTH